uniref:Plexin domain containing 1 n=1 Tax=Oryzias sinensis TaxID=183150 RepID=A0A8C8E2C8_9TELE
MTHIVEDSQKYYTWKSFGPTDRQADSLWVDLDSLHRSQVKIHGILSNTHRQAARVALSFDFPFYGHYLRQIIVATGGFIFMGDITHRMLTATQYAAPLMANFDPSSSTNSTVRYSDNGNLFVVQWDKVRLKDRENEGSFTFQAALHSNGTIVFNYRDIPIPVENMNSPEHPVKVGLSDAFMAFHPASMPGIKRRTIYEYHRVEIDATKIVSRSAFEFIPLPTCLQHTSCDLCLTSNLTTGCGWCNTLQRCSDGIDRHRLEWLEYNCTKEVKGSTVLKYRCSGCISSACDFDLAGCLLHQYPSHNCSTVLPHAGEERQTSAHDRAFRLLLNITIVKNVIVCFMQRHTPNYWPSTKFRNQGCHSSYAEVEFGVHEKEGFIEAEQCC